MNKLCHSANPQIACELDVTHVRSISARRLSPAFEVRVQDVHWPSSGQSRVHTGGRCTFELLLRDGPVHREAVYTVAGARGARSPVGRLNFLAPERALDLHWSSGHARSLVCMFDPIRLGLWDRQLGDWDDVDPLAALDIRNDRLAATMGWLLDELQCPSFASELQITSMLTLLALEAQRHFGARPQDSATGARKLSARQVSAVKECIEQAVPESVPLHALAAACGLSSRELPVMFKNTVGITLRSFVAASHIAKAKLLLSDPRLLVKQVAGRSGFESASAFTAAFRKATGMRPLQYREACGVRLRPHVDTE
jgi:AraC family transcriptional regulator